MTITITQRGIDMTPAIKAYVEEKMSSLQKYFDSIRHMDVEVGRHSHHHKKGEVFMCVARVQCGGQVLRIEKDADDLYKAIDKVRDHLRVELTDAKDKLEDRSQGKMS